MTQPTNPPNVSTTAGSAAVTLTPERWEGWLVAKIAQLRAARVSAIILFDAQTSTIRVWSGAPAGQVKTE